MKSPIFISGLRKSGTSMFKNLLDGHPELFAYPPNEFHFFRYSDHPSLLNVKTKKISDPDRIKNILAKTTFVEWLNDESTEGERRTYYRPQVNVNRFQKLVRSRTAKTNKDVFRIIFESMFFSSSHVEKTKEQVRFSSKSTLITEYFPELRKWFPDFKFIYVLRNPYAHFSSAMLTRRATDANKDRIPPWWNWKNKYPFVLPKINRMKVSYTMMKKFRSLFPDSFYVLTFDELLKDPEKEMRSVAKFLNLEFDEILLKPTICGTLWGGNSWHADEFEGISKNH